MPFGRPATARLTSSTKDDSWSCRAETFTQTLGARGNLDIQDRICPQAVLSTRSPSSIMRPDSSARGMNWPGDMAPRSG